MLTFAVMKHNRLHSKPLHTLAILLAGASPLHAENGLPADTATVVDIEEVVVVSTPKETDKLRTSPVSASLFAARELESTHTESLKELSAHVPNFYMPDYGSSLTSAAYIRGIGSRINTPAVGLYVDNVAYADKSAYDIDFLDVERIDVLRGPQGTLYGRNTMGGLIRVYTRNPFRYQGTDIRAGFSPRDDRYRIALSHHNRLNRRTALSAGAFYESARGFFENVRTGQPADEQHRTGGRLRLLWLPADRWKLDFSTDYSYRDEQGYAYRLEGGEDLPEDLRPYAGSICYNGAGFYRRSLLNSSLTATYGEEHFTLSSVTAYQNLNDNMTLDQDFTPRDYFSLTQRQRSNSWSEELTARSNGPRRWEWVGGLYALHQDLHIGSPVSLTEEFMRGTLATANRFMERYGAALDLNMQQSPFVSDGAFETPVTNLAVFHQSTFNKLFGVRGLSFTVGLRAEHERMSLEHHYGGTLRYDMDLTMNMMGQNRTMPMPDLADEAMFDGKLKRDYTQLLPKVALQYRIDRNNTVYASWSKGYRSGGFNVQMFSDLVQGRLSEQMKGHVHPVLKGIFDRIPMMPEAVKQQVLGQFAVPFDGTPADTYYKPEYSYNYEVGGHFALFEGLLQADVAAFYMDVRDQQISKMVESGLGRAMVNAGRGRSTGMEVAFRGCDARGRLTWNAAYGFTHSVFREYEAGTAQQPENYDGNRVPFVPRHTLSAGADYAFPLSRGKSLRKITVGADMTGAGEIYWTEDNRLKQPFYALLNGHVAFDFGHVTLNVWGKNLTDTRYDVFCFTNKVTMQELRFAQQGRPVQIGLDLKVHF